MARGHENLIPFDKRTEEEQRKIRSDGGKASGAARRRKADFRKTLNLLLTAEIDSPEWKPILESLGVECTLESAMLMGQIKAAMMGDSRAARFVAEYAGQSGKTDAEQEEQMVRTAAAKARAGLADEEEEQDDGFLDALKGSAEEDWADEDQE